VDNAAGMLFSQAATWFIIIMAATVLHTAHDAHRHDRLDPGEGLFTNVTTNPAEVASLAASYVIANSGGTAGVVILTDPEYAIETYTADAMAPTLRKCRHCSVLQIVDAPIADAEVNIPATINGLVETYGKRLTYLLAVNGAYITGARVALFGAGVQGDQPPFSVAAGDGDASEFERIRAGQYHFSMPGGQRSAGLPCHGR